MNIVYSTSGRSDTNWDHKEDNWPKPPIPTIQLTVMSAGAEMLLGEKRLTILLCNVGHGMQRFRREGFGTQQLTSTS